jgi:hypothetical protein
VDDVAVAAASLLSPSLHFLVNLLDLYLTKLSVLLAEPVAVAIVHEARKPSGTNATATPRPLHASSECGSAAKTAADALP